MQSYIVRVYRSSHLDEGSVSGILEDIESGQEKAFHSLNELQSMLSHSISKDQPRFPDLAPQELDARENVAVVNSQDLN